MRIAYVRVSSADQNEARQIEALKKYDIEKWFTEKVSGKDMNRPELQNMLEFAREGDTVYVEDFSRLARSTKDLLELVSMKENLDTATPTGKLMLTMIAAINEFERANILERQREGIELAKQRGVYKGRRAIEIEDFGKYYEKYLRRVYTKKELAEELGISRPTLDRLIAEYLDKYGDTK